MYNPANQDYNLTDPAGNRYQGNFSEWAKDFLGTSGFNREDPRGGWYNTTATSAGRRLAEENLAGAAGLSTLKNIMNVLYGGDFETKEQTGQNIANTLTELSRGPVRPVGSLKDLLAKVREGSKQSLGEAVSSSPEAIISGMKALAAAKYGALGANAIGRELSSRAYAASTANPQDKFAFLQGLADMGWDSDWEAPPLRADPPPLSQYPGEQIKDPFNEFRQML